MKNRKNICIIFNNFVDVFSVKLFDNIICDKEILAHSDVKTTMRYVHSVAGAKLDIIRSIVL